MRSRPNRLRSVRLALLASTLLSVALAAPLGGQQRTGDTALPGPPPDLGALVGTWNMIDLPPGATYVTTCERFPGGYQVVCRSQSRNNQGVEVQGLNVIAFSPADGNYQYVGMSSAGRLELLRGTFREGRMELTGTTGTGPTAVHTRVTIVPAAERLEISQEYREENGPWTESTRVRYVRGR